MGLITASVRHSLAGLGRFSGRDSQGQFWPWAVGVYAVATAATMIVTFGYMLDGLLGLLTAIGEGIQAADGRGDPAAASPERLDKLTAGMMNGIGDAWLPLALINAVAVLLLAAGVTRRLHDRGRTALWGLLPLPFMVAGTLVARRTIAIASGEPAQGPLDNMVLLVGPLTWVALIVLVVLMVGEGEPGPNRFGPPPVGPA